MLTDCIFLDRFWSKIIKSADVDDCWNWQASTTEKGYGRIWWNGKTRRAHRIAYELTYGNIADDIEVLHTCDNPSCCNPRHLFIGSQADNMRDREQKNRANHAANERHGRHKLTDEQVARLRRIYANRRVKYSTLAKLFRISIKQVWNILNMRNRTP